MGAYCLLQCNDWFNYNYQAARTVDKARETAHQTSLRSVVQREIEPWNLFNSVSEMERKLLDLRGLYFPPSPTRITIPALKAFSLSQKENTGVTVLRKIRNVLLFSCSFLRVLLRLKQVLSACGE